MTRARVTALGLVNWKGVFYERYLFDHHVTAVDHFPNVEDGDDGKHAAGGNQIGFHRGSLLWMVDGPFDNKHWRSSARCLSWCSRRSRGFYSVEDAGDARKPSTCWITAASLTMRWCPSPLVVTNFAPGHAAAIAAPSSQRTSRSSRS